MKKIANFKQMGKKDQKPTDEQCVVIMRPVTWKTYNSSKRDQRKGEIAQKVKDNVDKTNAYKERKRRKKLREQRDAERLAKAQAELEKTTKVMEKGPTTNPFEVLKGCKAEHKDSIDKLIKAAFGKEVK